MKAVGMHRFGGPEVLEVVTIPEPHAGPGEVRIRVRASGVNPADVMFRDGTLAEWYAGAEPPFVPGMDAAGVLDEIGTDVSDALALGQAVVAVIDNDAHHGGYGEYVVLPAASVVAMPSRLSFSEGASFAMNALTARVAVDALGLGPGSTLLVTGGAGAVGGFAIELAARTGVTVVAVGAPADEALLRSFGAQHVVAPGDQLASRVREAVPDGVDGAVDAAALGLLVVEAIRDGGRIAAVRPFDGDPGRGIRVEQVNVRDHVTDQRLLADLADLVQSGHLTPRVAAVLPAEQAADAHRRLAQGGLRGRLVLQW